MKDIVTKLDRLDKWFANIDSAIVAYSGGVDSTLVAYLARQRLGADRCLAVISESSSLKRSDLKQAKSFCHHHDIPIKVIETAEFDNPNYLENPPDRCYYCKYTLYQDLTTLREKMDFTVILNGHNIDDCKDYRPGSIAAKKFSISQPLQECGINKDDVRLLAQHFKLEIWDKPASPCLSSRVPYGQIITASKMQQIEAAETYIESLGFKIVRVRHLNDLAKVEVKKDDIKRLISLKNQLDINFKEFGFSQVEVDLEGYESGKLNRSLHE